VIQTHFQPSQTRANPSWVKSVVFQPQNDGTLAVYFPHTYFQEWFVQYLQEDFETFILGNFPEVSGFTYQKQKHSPSSQKEIFSPFQGDEQRTFARFLYNDRNREQVMTAQALSRQTKWPASSLLICGPRGCGKSHLLFAVANAMQENYPSGSVLALSCEDLTGITHLADQEQHQARTELQRAKALMLDDVHQLEFVPSQQEELVRLFDHLEETGSPMIFTSQDGITENGGLLPSLRSRLTGGTIVHLKRPDLDLRVQYVQQASDHYNLQLQDNDQLTLARRCLDFQALNQVLFGLAARSSLRISGKTKDVVKGISQRHTSQNTPLPCNEIIALVGKHFSLSPDLLTSTSRKQKVVLARQIAIYICRELHQISFTRIGALFGGRNHSSIIYAFKKIQSLEKERPEVKSQIETLLKHCANT
jgi:chromosomal replication initiator protein